MNTTTDFPQLTENQTLVLTALHRGDKVSDWASIQLVGRLRSLGLLVGRGPEIALTEKGAAVALVVTEHALFLSRRPLGRGAVAGSGMRYGSNGKCSCRDWETFSNESGRVGQSYVASAHNRHQAEHYPAALGTVCEQQADADAV